MLLPALTGFLLAASFPRISQGYLAWVAVIPLILFICKTATPGRAFLGGFFAGFIQLFALLIWIPRVLDHYGGLNAALAWLAYALMILMLACFPAAACAATKGLIKRGGKSWILIFPAVWVIFEYAQTLFPFGGLPWTLAGYSQARYLSIIQIADIAGIYGISFLILSMNTALAWIGLPEIRGRIKFVPPAAAILLVAACSLYGRISLHRYEKLHPDRKVAMLQGNLSVDDPESVLVEKYKKGYLRMAGSVSDEKADLLIFPESPSLNPLPPGNDL
jgi:apolipoprotein N-acyltransferase